MSPARRLLRLAPLALAVLAVHLLLLQQDDRKVAPAPPPAPVPFATRSVTPPTPAPAQAAPPPAPSPSVAPPAMPGPSPRPPRPARIAQPSTTPTAREDGTPSPPAPLPMPPAAAPSPSVPAAAPAPSAPGMQAATPKPAQAPVLVPPSMRLHYDVAASWRGLSLNGKAELAWRHDGQKYEARFEASTMGRARQQRSTGRIGPQGLEPDYFWEKSRNEHAAHFERDRGRVVFSNNRPPAPIVEGLQDRLSVVLQLAALVAGQPAAYPAGTQVTLPTAGTSDAEPWTFSVEGEEDLRLPGGAMRALKLHRMPRKEYDQRVELWLAARMDYAPVRLRLTNPNGDTVDQRWASTDR